MKPPRWRPALLAWYDASRRRLPWRERPTPYRVWVSEVMLQQTQVATALPHYRRFLARFPTVASLARAREAEVLRLWAGLGYYSRARNLLAAARRLARERGGRVPEDAAGLRRLPGVGRYTAGAILSIAFGRRAAVVDGNVARVLSRLEALRGDPRSAAFLRRAWSWAQAAVPRDRPGDWNQALMELGALVCVPKGPRCPECPLERRCRARRLGLQERLPESRRAAAPGSRRVALRWRALWIESGGRVLLWRRSAGERFLPGHWALPEPRHLGHLARPAARLGLVRHAITRHDIRLEVRAARLAAAGGSGASPGGAALPPPARWVPRRAVERRLVSSLWRKAAELGARPSDSAGQTHAARAPASVGWRKA